MEGCASVSMKSSLGKVPTGASISLWPERDARLPPGCRRLSAGAGAGLQAQFATGQLVICGLEITGIWFGGGGRGAPELSLDML